MNHRHLLAIFTLLAAPPLVAATGANGFAGSPFEGADTNGDGKVSRAEFVAARDGHFDAFDRNRDGVVNAQDFPRAANRPRIEARVNAYIQASDLNHDGALSRAELRAAGTPGFDRVDTDHDGMVTLAEAGAARQKMAGRRRTQP